MKSFGQRLGTLSPRKLRWLLNCFQPWWFQRVRAVSIGADFRSARVVVRRSWLNGNLNGSIFGGSLTAAVDPVHAVLLWQVFAHRGRRVVAWSADVRVVFEAPARTDVTFEFHIEEQELAELERALETRGRAQKRFEVEGRDVHGTLTVRGQVVVALRPVPALADDSWVRAE